MRHIGLLAVLARVWERSRRFVSRGWEAANARTYWWGVSARSAEGCAWAQSIRAESADASR